MKPLWKHIAPQLPVTDVVKTQEYYRDVLGFEIAWLYENNFGAVYNGEIELFFVKADLPLSKCYCYIFVDNADEIYAIYQKNRAKILEPLASKPWGTREFIIEDINGHIFRIGHGEKEIKEIEQFIL